MSASIAVVDYGVGNLRSVERALLRAGARVVIAGSPDEVAAADGAVLPGVGAFRPAAQALHDGFAEALHDLIARRRPVLGVCLGHQLLYGRSEESPEVRGLGVIRGSVVRLQSDHVKVPHIGWNRLRILRPSRLLEGVDDGAFAYFVHSYAARTDVDSVVATTDHGGEVVAVVEHGTAFGTQFHPEKSAALGLRVYRNFVDVCRAPSPELMAHA